MIVPRDRGGGYGEAAEKAPPDAVQVADCWHLMENVSAGLPRRGAPFHWGDPHRSRCDDDQSKTAHLRGKAFPHSSKPACCLPKISGPSLIFPFLARLRPENSSTATGWVETQWSLESCRRTEILFDRDASYGHEDGSRQIKLERVIGVNSSMPTPRVQVPSLLKPLAFSAA
jgi:hypothetical protein